VASASAPPCCVPGRSEGPRGKRAERNDQRHKGKCVREKCRSRAPPPGKKTGQRRPSQPRSMKHGTIKCDGGANLVALHQLWHKRGDGRHFIGKSNPQQKREKDYMPDLNAPAHYQKPKRDRENDLHNLGCNQDLAFVPSISERTGYWSERKRRQTGSEIHK